MAITPELRRMIHRSAPSHELRRQVRQQGGLTLHDEGVQLALDNKTCLEEILRVTQYDDDLGIENSTSHETNSRSVA